MEKLKLIFAIFFLFVLVSFVTGYGVEQFGPYGKETTGVMLISSSIWTIFLVFYEIFRGK